MKNARFNLIIFAVFMCAPITGCGFYSNDNHTETRAEDESIYQAGNPVPALGFRDSQSIVLYVKGADGAFTKVEDGAYLERGTHTFGVTVTPRTVNGATMGQVVQISDGGWVEEKYVEASYDADRKMYLADFTLEGPLSAPILIQVIYPDKKASKAKFVVTIAQDLAAPDGALVDRGLSVTLSDDFLHTLPSAVNTLLAEQLGSIKIRDIAPADNTSAGKAADGVLNVDVMGVKCDVILNDTSRNLNGSTTRGLTVGIEDVTGGTAGNLLELITGAFAKLFLRKLNIDNIPVMALGFPLNSLVTGMMSSSALPIGDMLPEGMSLDVALDSTLFLNLKGYPAETTADFAVLGGALYVPDNDDIAKDKDGNLLWPEVTLDSYITGIDKDSLAIIESTGTANPTDIGVALSQYNLNQMLQGLMKGLRITIPSINKSFALFSPKVAGDNVDLVLTINPKGMAIDFTTQTIVVNDVELLMVESGAVNANVAELSLDLTLLFEASIAADKLALNVSVRPDQDYSHMHVMKDDAGLGALDHGRFIPVIFQYLSGGEDALSLSIPLDGLGLKARAGVASNGAITMDDKGNCFMGMAVGGLDASKLPTSGCFIATTGL